MPSLLPEPSSRAPGPAAPTPTAPLFDSWFLPLDIDEEDGACAANDVEPRPAAPAERARASAR